MALDNEIRSVLGEASTQSHCRVKKLGQPLLLLCLREIFGRGRPLCNEDNDLVGQALITQVRDRTTFGADRRELRERLGDGVSPRHNASTVVGGIRARLGELTRVQADDADTQTADLCFEVRRHVSHGSIIDAGTGTTQLVWSAGTGVV